MYLVSRQIWPIAGGIVLALVGTSAGAQDLTAGKSPAQLFASDCTACHKSPQGLARGRSASALASFLNEHYTTKPASAGALAGYLASVGGRAPPAEPASRQRPAAARPDEAKPPEHSGAAERRQAPEGAVETATAPRPKPAETAKLAPMSKAERIKLYLSSGDHSQPDERSEAERRSEDPATRLQAYAGSGAGADAVGHDAANNSSSAENAARKRRAARAVDRTGEISPVEAAPSAPEPTLPGESAVPAPSSASPSEQPSEESR
jgi:hypothetical protein